MGAAQNLKMGLFHTVGAHQKLKAHPGALLGPARFPAQALFARRGRRLRPLGGRRRQGPQAPDLARHFRGGAVDVGLGGKAAHAEA